MVFENEMKSKQNCDSFEIFVLVQQSAKIW